MPTRLMVLCQRHQKCTVVQWRCMVEQACDTIAINFSIDKSSGLKQLDQNTHSLHEYNCLSRSWQDVQQGTAFVLSCCGSSPCHSTTKGRQKMWSLKIAKQLVGHQHLRRCCLQANHLKTIVWNASLEINVAYAHPQVAIWKCTPDENPLMLDTKDHN